jgi:tetratricopeptide (TPR) repeat protein
MGRLAHFFWQRIRHWERPAQYGFLLAVGFMVVLLVALAFGPDSWRQPALIGLFGLVITAQLIFMWANRTMVTPFTQAQRLYLAEDFEGACSILEDLRASGRATVQALTLLGNTYRQRNMLAESAAALREALALAPNHQFPLYGFGRTLLIQGQYSEAAEAIEQALAAGAPPLVHFDAGEAYFRGGRYDRATVCLQTAVNHSLETPRALLAAYMLYQMNAGAVPAADLIEAGLIYWQAQADRYHNTPYGQSLAQDVAALHRLLKEA